MRLSGDTFKTIRVIGRGSFGEVLLVQMRGTNKLYAMKKLNKSKMIERNQVAHIKAERGPSLRLCSPSHPSSP